MSDGLTSARALTLYLLVPDLKDSLDAVATDDLPDLYDLDVVPGIEWVLVVKNSRGERPKWSDFFTKHFDINRFGLNSSVSALLIIPHEGRHWAVTFGRGRFLLREGVIEERFGLRLALNAIGRDKVRAIDKETFDSFAAQARQQATDDTDFGNFGVDVDRDLLYAVAGVPRDTRLGRRLAGRDALCASVRVTIEGLPDYLSLVLSTYGSGAYRDEGFGWVDNIYEVRDKSHKRVLDDHLVDKLQEKPLRNAWLTVPEILDWQRVGGFSYANPSPPFTIRDVHLSTFLDGFKRRSTPIDILSIKRSRVTCIDHNGDIIHRWNAYRCLYAEVPVSDDIYLLTNGHWYKINKEIVDDIKIWYEALSIETSLLPEMQKGEGEDDYNKRLGREGNYHLFHGSPIHLPANRGPIEFCDLAALGTDSLDLVHVKRYGPSSKLSHLFFQGTNSARLFRTSPEFRKALSKSVTQENELAGRLSEEPARHACRVVFAIASSSTSRLELPLFSKLSLRQALRELDGMGFKAALAHIAVPEEERKLKTLKSKRRTF